MNKHLHRVIFNAARGQRVAVHEAASSNSGRGRLKATAVAGFIALASQGQTSLAQIAGDPSAPANQRPVVVTAPNGTPLVNIQTPSAGGVSRNTYRQFDVGSQGAILNNSRTQTQSQLGGWVQGNPYLANGPARIILNEVNSTSPSHLRGYVEVAGQRAEVIIANPAGIQINGGGFLNASRATLTTGTPKFNDAGSLESFLVRGGTVTVEGAGLDASKTDYAATIAARQRLDIGAQEINNSGKSLILSEGALYIGGKLNEQGGAIEGAAALNNQGASIESAGNMGIAAVALNNISEGIGWEVQPGETKRVVQYSVAGDPKRYDPSEILFISGYSSEAYDASDDPYAFGSDPDTYLLLPSPEYPLERYRPYYLKPPGRPVDWSYDTYVNTDTTTTTNVPAAVYEPSDPIWATFGVQAPVEPAGNPFQYAGVKVGDTRHVYYDNSGQYPVQKEIAFDHPATQAEQDQWQAYMDASEQAKLDLDAALQKFFDSYQRRIYGGDPGRQFRRWTVYDLTVSTPTATGKVQEPARIVAGGNMAIQLAAGRNRQGQILAGGELKVTGGVIVNEPATFTVDRQTEGDAIYSYVKSNSGFQSAERKYDKSPYSSSEPVTIQLTAGKVEGNQGNLALASGAGPRSGGLPTITEVRSAQDGGMAGSNRPNLLAGAAIAAAIGEVPPPQPKPPIRDAVVRTSTPNAGLPTASLFGVASPGKGYIVETDPRFAGYRQWLSSDYLLNNLGLDPQATQKRLGDGYYEQRLVRDQVAYLTGYRFLDGFASDEAQYLALMNAGTTFAQKYNLRPGVALSAEQMAQLTSDIVWLPAYDRGVFDRAFMNDGSKAAAGKPN